MERAAYRIIDANFNRAREGLRVIEDYCRFYLNSAPLTERAKGLRHELSAAIENVNAGQLLASRDTLGDVGINSRIDEQLKRTDLKSAFTAACKRLTEALRTLTEVIQTQNQPVAQAIEKLRFDAYELEKDIVLFAEPAEKFKHVELYIVISSSLPLEVIRLAGACAAGGADCIQLRAKDINDDRLYAIAVEFVKVCKDAQIITIINDRVDVAVASGADGVHLGQNDLPIEQAKRLALTPLIIGKSTHSLDQLHTACDQFPTYVSMGPVFSTGTKPQAAPVGLDYVRNATKQLANTGIGHVAIGGITVDNVQKVLEAGAKAIAVCSAVTQASNPTAACRLLKEKIAAFNKTRDMKSEIQNTKS
jgi:thiamine-phosphate pyrophosphorylase